MFRRLSTTGILMIPLCVYLYFVIRRILKIFAESKNVWLQRGLSALLAVLVTMPAFDLFGLWAAVLLHFAVISAMIDIISLVLRLRRHFCDSRSCGGHSSGEYSCGGRPCRRQPSGKRPCEGGLSWRGSVLAAVITLAVFGYAYVNMHRVNTTEYTVYTEKNIREAGYDIVFLSDLHFGTTMGQEKLAKYCERMEEEKPDIVILGGDIVDESTSLDQVREAFQTLGRIDSAYGVYYVYGNHDKGRYSEDCEFTEAELSQVIQDCGIRILEDETVEMNGELSLSGRKDRSDVRMSGQERKASWKLLRDIPDTSFHILADHQPRGMEKNEKAGYDLMLSGHTHAGQMWPVGLITTLFDKENLNYGQKNYGNMELIVSSGIAGWGYPFRTGKHCEFVVVHIGHSAKGAV